MPWTALRTRTSQRCWTRGSATSATTSLSTVSHRLVKNNKLNKNKVDPTTKWTNRPIIGLVSVQLPNSLEFRLIGRPIGPLSIYCYSGEPFALPEGQEDLHLHPLPRPDDLQAAVGDQGCGDPDDQGAFTFTLILKSVIISHGSCRYQIRIKLKAKEDSESPNPTSWLSNEAWAQICSLQQLEAFKVKQEGKDVASM